MNGVQDEAASTSPENSAQLNDPTVDYTISAAVSGLTGSGMVLQDNGGSNLSIPSNGTYAFSTEIPAGGSYDVTVLTQPSDQTCTVAKHKGTANSNVTVTVTCVATYSISAAVSGLTGTKQGLTLKNNGEDKLTISGNGTFTFSSRYKAGKTYDVTVYTQPTGETCTVANPTGTIESDVTVTVTCSAPGYSISAAVSGLTGTGLVLQDNGGSNLSIPSNGTYTFSMQINAGGTYDVTVLTQPTGQTCTVTSPTGTANSNVTVTVTCVAITYTISATVSGLTGTGLVLQDNGGSNLSIPSNGTYAFTTTIPPGGSYDVTILTQPSGQSCTVSNPSGTANSNVTVTVTCSINEFTWQSGADTTDQSGVYGTKGKASPSNAPGARYGANTWTDSSGNLWMFGGFAYDINGDVNFIDDLWKYSGGEWTWVNGSNAEDQAGVYGTLGVPAGTNQPGARAYAVSWKDSSGNFWIFGGYGADSLGDYGALNDLWEYTITGGEWIWQGGSNVNGQSGTYGTLGQGSSSNIPGARYSASGAVDSSGTFWLFGGVAIDSQASQGPINDLWKYSGGQWTWVSGSNIIQQTGTYSGTGSVPGAREGQNGWIDSSGNFWVFAGNGIDSAGNYGYLNDLWEYSAGQWTWVNGANVINQPASYGIEGEPSSANVPGSREYSAGWLDLSGNFWMFGGVQEGDRLLTDLWKYSAGEWTWINGSQSTGVWGDYGTLGKAANTNLPGSRQLAQTWTDKSGNLWLFGGYGLAVSGAEGSLSDLWEYQQ